MQSEQTVFSHDCLLMWKSGVVCPSLIIVCLPSLVFQGVSADFNQAFATSVLNDIENLVAEPWDRVLNIAYTTFSSAGSYLFENKKQEIPTIVNTTQEFMWSLYSPVDDLLDWVYVGFYDGGFYAYTAGSYLYQENRNYSRFDYVNSTSTVDGKITGPPASNLSTYDCTKRPWYIESEEDGSVWTDPYVYISVGGAAPGVGITAELPIVNKHGEFLGVFAADYLLSNLDTVLAAKVAPITSTFFLIYIIDDEGLMIAASIEGISTSGTDRVRANHSSYDLIRLSAIEIENYGGNWSAADGVLLSIDVPDDGVYFIQSNELVEEHGLHWHIIVAELVSCDVNFYTPKEFNDVLIDNDDTCKDCPENLQCDGEDYYPYPKSGYWMDREYSIIHKSNYECVRDTCLGFKPKMKLIYSNNKNDFNYDDFNDFYDDMMDLCWKRGTIDIVNDTRCDSDYLMCEKGSTGPLCGSCMNSFTYNSATRKCINCNGVETVIPAIVIGCIAGFIVICMIAFILKDSSMFGGRGLDETEKNIRKLLNSLLSIPPFSVLKHVDQGMVKVVWATCQIIGTISWNLSIRYPQPFDGLLKILSYLQLNFFALDCQFPGANFTSRVLFNSFGPMVVSFIILFGYLIRVAFVADIELERKRIMEQHLYIFLLLGFIVLPTVSMLQFTALECTDLSDGSSYLRVDTSINCHSTSYKNFLIIDGFLIFVYQSVPLLWLILLYRIRHKLNPKGADKFRVKTETKQNKGRRGNVTLSAAALTSGSPLATPGGMAPAGLLSENEKTAVRGRNGDPTIQYLSFLWKDYMPERWYFEVFEMYRRIIFIAVIPLMGNETSIRAIIGCMLSLIMIGFVREAAPFIRGATNVLMCVAQYQIFLTFFAAFIIVTDGLSHLGMSNFGLGVLLFSINIVILGLLAMWSFRRYFKELKKKRWRKALNDVEYGIINAVMAENQTMYFGKDSKVKNQTFLEKAVHKAKSGISHLQHKDPEKDIEMAKINHKNHEESKGKFGKYLLDPNLVEMDKKIGAGAFGEVFKGTVKGDKVAIKTMINVTEKTAKLFRAEIILTATLKHPNIVNFIGACWGRELTCLILEWVPKGTLGDLLESESNHELTWLDPMLKMATEMVQGLQYLHSADDPNAEGASSKQCILHRDMKPDNVLITEFLSCKITDFGTSRAKEMNATITMSAVGTPLFCAPEIMRGEIYDESVDVYSFGLMLLDMCVDGSFTTYVGEKWRIDHNKKTIPKQPMRFIRSMTEEGWRPLDAKAEDLPQVPKSIIALILICFNHDPTQRPSFSQVLKALQGPCHEEIRNLHEFKNFGNIFNHQGKNDVDDDDGEDDEAKKDNETDQILDTFKAPTLKQPTLQSNSSVSRSTENGTSI